VHNAAIKLDKGTETNKGPTGMSDSPIDPNSEELNSLQLASLITGSGELSNLIRAFDWAGTPLGPIASWSETLLAAVNLMLCSPFPTILSWGPEMVFLYNDPAIPTLAGKHPKALGGDFQKVFHEAWDLVRDDIEACYLRGETPVRDNIFIPILLNGIIEDHYWSYSLIPVYEKGRIAGVYDAYRNMTDLVEGARKLRESEERLTLATEVAKIGVFVWNITEDRASWENNQMYEIFGRNPEDGPINGAAFINEVVHPEDREAFQQAAIAALKKGSKFQFEGRIRLPDGAIRWIEVSGQLQSEDSTRQILGTVRDITSNKESEQVLQEASKRLSELASIVDSSDDVIISKDLNGIITSWNAAATRLFGYSADEMIGSSILKIIPPDLHSDEKVIIENIRAGRRVDHFETVRLNKSGQRLEVSITVSPVRDKQGTVIGASKILRDISGRKLIEKSLVQAEKIAATGRMAATIAHEINNPLEAVVNLHYLLRPKISDPEGIRLLDTIESELARVSHIAKQTLGYYRENASPSSSSLAELVRHAITIYQPRCTAAGIEIKEALESDRKIMLRRGEIMQVISNLISNSIYAMPKGGTLAISVKDATSPSDGVTMTIQDNGVGISAESLPYVFDAFFTTRSTVGTGIGLFISKQLVEGHNGKIQIQSHTGAQNHGTTVSVFLPISST
jgi:PAS domain S-box-containing protein